MLASIACINGARKTHLKNSSISMLAKWMHVEESEGIYVDEEEAVDEDKSELQAEDKVSLLTNALKHYI